MTDIKRCTTVVGFHGPMGSGKNTAAAMLAEMLAEQGISATLHSFAAPLRESICVLTAGAVAVDEQKTAALPPGALGKTLGELKTRICWALSYALGEPVKEGGRIISKPALVAAAAAVAEVKFAAGDPDTRAFESPPKTYGRLLQLFGTEVGVALRDTIWVDMAWARLKPGAVGIFTDVRFPHEARRIAGAGGLVVGIKRARPPTAGIVAGRDTGHSSEKALGGGAVDMWIDNSGTADDLMTAVCAVANCVYSPEVRAQQLRK